MPFLRKKNILWKYFYLFFSALCAFLPVSSKAQQVFSSENDMQTVFVSGGYGALFGAAMGAAVLPFINNSPLQNLRIVAGGASLGFMVGSVFGFYNVAKSNRGSYFNYNPEPDENNFYYSMPPTYPNEGQMKDSAPVHFAALSKKEIRTHMETPKKLVPNAFLTWDGTNPNPHVMFPAILLEDFGLEFHFVQINF